MIVKNGTSSCGLWSVGGLNTMNEKGECKWHYCSSAKFKQTLQILDCTAATFYVIFSVFLCTTTYNSVPVKLLPSRSTCQKSTPEKQLIYAVKKSQTYKMLQIIIVKLIILNNWPCARPGECVNPKILINVTISKWQSLDKDDNIQYNKNEMQCV